MHSTENMNLKFASSLIPHLKRIKLVGLALAMVFLANLSWSQLFHQSSDSGKPVCMMRASSMQHASQQMNAANDCCPKSGHSVPGKGKPECCKHPCLQVVAQVPALLVDSQLAPMFFQTQLPSLRYQDRWGASSSAPELRPPII